MFELLFGFFGFCFFVGIIFLLKAVYLVKQAEVVVIERFGKYYRILSPGLHVIVPFIVRLIVKNI